MNCKRVYKLIYLKKEEMSEHEFKKLKKHLEECITCRIEREKFMESELIISRLNKFETEFKESLLVEENILKTIEQSKNVIREFNMNNIIDRISEFFTVPSVRYIVSVFLILTFSIFFFEEYSTAIGISRLEESISKNFKQGVITSGVFEDQLKVLNAIPGLYRILSGAKNFAMLSEDWMIMNKSELKSLLRISNGLNSIKAELPPDFKNKYPVLAEFVGRDLDESKFDELLNQKKEILIELNKFWKEGGIKNEIKE